MVHTGFPSTPKPLLRCYQPILFGNVTRPNPSLAVPIAKKLHSLIWAAPSRFTCVGVGVSRNSACVFYLCPKGERQRKRKRRPMVMIKMRMRMRMESCVKLEPRSLFKYHKLITIHIRKYNRAIGTPIALSSLQTPIENRYPLNIAG